MALGTIIEKVISGGAKILDDVITTKEEKMQLYNELEQIYLNDRDSARKMYESDSSLQKIYAIVFLISYMLLIVAMLVFIFNISGASSLEIPDWAVAFLSSLFGAMTTKVGTITDFLFGGSKTAEVKERKR